MSPENELKSLVTRALGAKEAERTLAYQLPDLTVLENTAQQLLRMTPPNAEASVLMSAAWALHLRDKYDMPAVAVAGDLKVADRWIFRATDALPAFPKAGQASKSGWRGHCWVEVGGMVCDVSILRTVCSLPPDNASRQFFEGLFGTAGGALILKSSEMPAGLKYRRRAILGDGQMSGFFESLRFAIEGERPR